MPALTYKTGRERTLLYSGTLAGSHRSQWVCYDPGDPMDRVVVQESYSRPRFDMGALGAEVGYVSSEGGSTPPPGSCSGGSGNVGNRCYARVVGVPTTGAPGDVMNDDNTVVTATFTRPGGFTRPIEGTWAIEVGVEEFAVLVPILETDADWSDDLGWPREHALVAGTGDVYYYGEAYRDGLKGFRWEFYEKAKPGSTLTAAIAVDGNSAAAQCAITSANAFVVTKPFPPLPGDIDYGWRCVTRSYTFRWVIEAAATCRFCDLVDLAAPYHEVLGDAEADCRTGCDATSPADPLLATYCICGCALFPPITYSLDFRARALGLAYPATMKLRTRSRSGGSEGLGRTRIDDAAPTAAATFQQLRYGCDSDLNGGGGASVLVDEWIPCRSWLDVDTLGTLGEDVRDWRVRYQLYPWRCATIGHAATFSVASNKSLSAADEAVPLTTSVLEGYRYLRFSCTSNFASRDCVLTLGGKEYTFVSPASGVPGTITIDLCEPSNLPAEFSVDERDGRYPLEITGAGPYSPTGGKPDVDTSAVAGEDEGDGWLFGCLERPTEFTIALDGAETLALSAIQLVRTTTREATVLEPFMADPEGWESETDHTFLQPILWLYSDSKQAAWWPHRARVEPKSLAAHSYTFWSLATLETFVDYTPGWTYVPASDPTGQPMLMPALTTPLLSQSNYAGNLEPYVFDGTAWRNQVGMDPSGAGAALWSALLVDELQAYPLCPTPGDDYGDGPFALRASKSLRAQAEGLVLFSGPVAGASIVAYVEASPATVAGTATSGALGEYRTGAPNKPVAVEIATELRRGPTPYPHELADWANRFRHRTSFSAPGEQATGPWRHDLADGGCHVAATNSDGDVVVRSSAFYRPAPAWRFVRTITSGGGCRSPRVWTDPRTGRAWCVWETDAGCYESYSTSDGDLWSTPALWEATLRQPDGASAPNGDQIRAGFVPDVDPTDPGVVKARFRAAGAASWGALTTLKTAAAADIRVEAGGWGNISAGRAGIAPWVLTIIAEGETEPSTWICTDESALTFERV